MCTFPPISLPCRRIFCDLTPQIVCQYHLIKRWFCKIIAAHHYFSFSHFDKEYKIKPYNKARDLRHFTASFASFHRVICLILHDEMMQIIQSLNAVLYVIAVQR